jgi:hypothetical protein
MASPYPNPPRQSQHIGSLDITAAPYNLATWQQFTSGSFKDQTDTADALASLPAGKRLAYLDVDNVSTATVFVSLAARGLAFVTTHCIPCPGSTSTRIGVPQGEKGKKVILTFSVKKDAIADEVYLTAGFDA